MTTPSKRSRSSSSDTLWDFIDESDVEAVREGLEENRILSVSQAAGLFEKHLGISSSTFYRRGLHEELPFAYYLRETPEIKEAQVLAVIQFLKKHPRYLKGESAEDALWQVNSS